ncbi:insulin-like growth factor-binding protein complex acid labile subunit isoform X1 [Mya arenaria]|uniref:insulin-like growth factor-binding protein complex acid labile subunit isoform X1 n=1 Tax=Mya arenaria TaxID=6604 RepID=UPI0022E2635D|nr:insulin-like growth factor-binding protein complex acid labile subunit isoform X1 [Mya arenaria]
MKFVIGLVCFFNLTFANYYNERHYPGQGGHVRRHVADGPGSRGDEGGAGAGDCPLQCRCIALTHLGYRDMAERWMSMGRLDGVGNTFKGTEAPTWMEDPEELRGRDVVCMGLNKVPRPLPENTMKMTLYGDSSASSMEKETQVTYLRDTSFQQGDNLRQLTISGNNLHILYPFVFRGLPSLENLALQNNNISYISAATFARLDNLLELRLSGNSLQFLSPNVFGSLLNMQYLFLNGNKLSTLHVHLLRNLASLQHLDLSRNNFRTFEDSVFDGAVNLQELLINENQIWYVRSRWFQKLAMLRRLEIRANVITRIDPRSFETLTNLKQLSLSANIINTVSNGAFKNVSKLEELDIGTNDISMLEPDCFDSLNSLDILKLSDNKISFINNKTFVSTPKLRQLEMSKNTISDIEEAALHPLTFLEKLDLSYNKLKKIERKTFTGLMELRNLNLEHNIISDVENDAFIVAPLNQLSKITWLSLQYNRLKEINGYALYGLPHMKFLNLGHNRIRHVHNKSLYTLSSLQNLLLNDNKIRNFEDNTFVNLKQLTSLNLENNKISTVNDNTFIGLANLEDINIVSNGLKTISQNALRHFSSLSTLTLKSNLLSTFSFEDILLLKKITVVDLSNNILYRVTFPNQKTHNIRQLELSTNRLETLSPDVANVLAPGGNVWLGDNPLSCDCRLAWLPDSIRQSYKLRLLGTTKTVCTSPPSLHGMKVMDVASSNFQCDNATLSEPLTCQNLQIKDTTKIQKQKVGKGKRETRKWHVTLRALDNTKNTTRACYGLLVKDNWVLMRQSCAIENLPITSANIIVKIGRKESRKILLSVDHVTAPGVKEFDLRLIRLAPNRKRDNSLLPCILSHSQFYQLSKEMNEAIHTTKVYKNETGKWRLQAKRGILLPKCKKISSICVRSYRTDSGEHTYGSPLSLRYQGVWYSAGLGMDNELAKRSEINFTPLWTVTDWMGSTIHEIDSKCKFQLKKNTPPLALCENLEFRGHLESDYGQDF